MLLFVTGFIYFHNSNVIKTTFPSKNKSNSLLHQKWIVITTTNHPTKEIERLANINGWKLLVVANRKTPRNWSYKNVHFLSMDDQLRMGYRITSNLSDKFYAHKNIGYLYAIEHGARWIYDTDDHYIPYDFLFSSPTSQ
ncbi:hypothetical protein RB195_013084 [Necator americanus]